MWAQIWPHSCHPSLCFQYLHWHPLKSPSLQKVCASPLSLLILAQLHPPRFMHALGSLHSLGSLCCMHALARCSVLCLCAPAATLNISISLFKAPYDATHAYQGEGPSKSFFCMFLSSVPIPCACSCPPGEHQPTEGSSTCIQCSAGTYSDLGAAGEWPRLM